MKKKLLPLAAAAATALSINTHAAVDMFLKLEGIEGESRDKTHIKEVDVLAWSWGMSQSGTTHLGAGSDAGKANFTDINVTKWVDKASVELMRKLATGAHIPTAKLVVRKAGSSALEYIVLEMKEVIVTSVSSGGSGGEDRLTENVSLNFSHFCIEYKEQLENGTVGSKPKFCYDIARNIATN